MEQLNRAMDALNDPELRKELTREATLDDLEQRIFDVNKRVKALRRPGNRKVRMAVQIGIATRRGPGRGGAR